MFLKILQCDDLRAQSFADIMYSFVWLYFNQKTPLRPIKMRTLLLSIL